MLNFPLWKQLLTWALVIVGLSVFGITRYDRDAFMPGSREEAEHAEHHASASALRIVGQDDHDED